MADVETEPDRPGVRPEPVPTAFGVATAATEDGRALIVLQAQTPVGLAVYFLEPGAAIQIGNALRAEGKAAAAPLSKLAVPPSNGLIIPG